MLYRTGKDPALICPAIEEDLRIATKWADIWGMRFNANKTVAMYISRTTATPPPITFAGATLEYSHEHRHLGFILDSALSFHAHVNALTRKGATEVFLLRRLSYKVKDRDLLLKIYKMYVRPHLEYASPAPLYNIGLSILFLNSSTAVPQMAFFLERVKLQLSS
ncbi:hypothetical protein CAPTEDRAFT_193619 [Capitella teleta]|uniref:Reverse transcriptase domain-containing protein n=1 Tax=Capitella teleta TaxID=283909 RepID=R7VI31_CAPTE|nr:hypothetical protein CAPTEDRAFT_193619 [Capitella teleta]|eukprot:ELU15966.1 hypothetical protein CAPTEDRAFT_193619 [Capitella teleta]